VETGFSNANSFADHDMVSFNSTTKGINEPFYSKGALKPKSAYFVFGFLSGDPS
jgi:hypothetical protein